MSEIEEIVISPKGTLEFLSRSEISALYEKKGSRIYADFKRCVYSILNVSSRDEYYSKSFKRFDIDVKPSSKGIELVLKNPPMEAFLDGKMILGTREFLFSILRDLLYSRSKTQEVSEEVSSSKISEDITNDIFYLLRNAGIFKTKKKKVGLVVCWGGNSIGEEEYRYSKSVGYALGLRGMDICTGCGGGAMKGPMKGAAIAHSKQRIKTGRYLGITEPGIIDSESPNAIVSELILMPDLEKRIESFVRLAHGFVVFPGGVGTLDEIFYLLGILHVNSFEGGHFPLVFTGPEKSFKYFQELERLFVLIFGEEVKRYYKIVINNPFSVSAYFDVEVKKIFCSREKSKSSFHYNWLLKIPFDYQNPKNTNYEALEKIFLTKKDSISELAYKLRCVFSFIVAGHVHRGMIEKVKQKGPILIRGDKAILTCLQDVLEMLVQQKRMNINEKTYVPCYRLDV